MINNILRPITFGWKYCKINLILEDMSHLTLVTPNSAKSNIPYKLVRRICTIVENSDVRKNHLEESRKLYVLVISCTRFRVNPHSIVALTSRNSLLEAGAKSEVQLDMSVWPNSGVFVYELNGSAFEFSCSHLNIEKFYVPKNIYKA